MTPRHLSLAESFSTLGRLNLRKTGISAALLRGTAFDARPTYRLWCHPPPEPPRLEKRECSM